MNMNILIVYSTKYGSTESFMEIVKSKLHQELGEGLKSVVLINLKEDKHFEIEDFDYIVLASPIYMGNIRKELRKFIDKNKVKLLKKPYSVLLLGGSEVEVKRNFHVYIGKNIYDKAKLNIHLGYEYDLSKLNFFEKIILKKIAKVKENKKLIKEEEIMSLIENIKA